MSRSTVRAEGFCEISEIGSIGVRSYSTPLWYAPVLRELDET